MTDEERKRQELLKVLAESAEEAARIEGQKREEMRAAHIVGEVARAEHALVSLSSNILSAEETDRQIKEWGIWKASAAEIRTPGTSSKDFVAKSLVMTSTGTHTFFSSVVRVPAEHPKVKEVETQLVTVLEREGLVDKARGEIVRLGLGHAPGSGRSPLDRLGEAVRAYGTGPIAALIPIREAINGAVEQLIRRRPTQEKAGGHQGKVVSLGKQCRRSGVEELLFETLGKDQETLVNDLSVAKDKAMAPEQVSALFHRALLHLTALLGSLDEACFKSPSAGR